METMTVLDSGFGVWQPIIWVAAFLLVILITYIIRSFGTDKYQKESDQVKPFLSGCEEPDVNKIHIRASNLYWGFTETLKGYYEKIVAMHTGNTVDYLIWFFGVMAITLLAGLGL